MITEIVNYIKYLQKDSPEVLDANLTPTKGVHILVRMNEDGNFKQLPGVRGVDWDYYDKDITPFLKRIAHIEKEGVRIGTGMNKVFDSDKKIMTCSPYIVGFKKDKLDEAIKGKNVITSLDYYFGKAIEVCIENEDKDKIYRFRDFLKENLKRITDEINREIKLPRKVYISFYLEEDEELYKKAHDRYLIKNLFNKDIYNTSKDVNPETYGLSDFYNGLNDKKTFLKHTTGITYKGVNYRIKSDDAVYLFLFDQMLKRKVFPNPLPLFIYEDEFKNTTEMIKIFSQNDKISYSEIIRKLFEQNEDRVLSNYYLLSFNYKREIKDFDFVPMFRYCLKENKEYIKIENVLQLKSFRTIKIQNIFDFEREVVKKIFNTGNINYFNDLDNNYVNGGELMYDLILRYRNAFYDYIYKSKTQAINSYMWDEIMYNSILDDIRSDSLERSRGYDIKHKLNIWFSLYNYFSKEEGRDNMASRIPELLEKMRSISNSNNEHFDSIEEFAFGAGQVIFYLLNQSKTEEKTHSLLEPFLQKVSVTNLQNAIVSTFNVYKHEISFGNGHFERLAREVLGFESKENIKNYQRLLLAGYFSPSVIYEKTNID